ncbi:dienelactone hydrolase family protein [Candidatus Saccharibacteria bacterium]|nr:dienelactone hydrolase family protein [Candidatus Saccharibacteria bacterium]
MNKPYIYESKSNKNYAKAMVAIIVLPDIYGLTDYSKQTVEEFAKEFQRPIYMFDYFYVLADQPSVFSGDDREKAHELMQRLKGEDFVGSFKKVLNEISAENSSVKSLGVIGFCFGGRLAYLAGLEPSVNRIVSFYGAGAHMPDYYEGQSPIEALTKARANDTGLGVLSFYGTQDGSIPPEDRQKTQTELNQAGIAYKAREYDTGHAYFQPGRDNYDKSAAEASQKDLKELLND